MIEAAEVVPIKVDDEGVPVAINRLRWEAVRVMEYWLDIGSWWTGEREKEFYRLLTSKGAVIEVYYEGELWYLYKIYD